MENDADGAVQNSGRTDVFNPNVPGAVQNVCQGGGDADGDAINSGRTDVANPSVDAPATGPTPDWPTGGDANA